MFWQATAFKTPRFGVRWPFFLFFLGGGATSKIWSASACFEKRPPRNHPDLKCAGLFWGAGSKQATGTPQIPEAAAPQNRPANSISWCFAGGRPSKKASALQIVVFWRWSPAKTSQRIPNLGVLDVAASQNKPAHHEPRRLRDNRPPKTSQCTPKLDVFDVAGFQNSTGSSNPWYFVGGQFSR